MIYAALFALIIGAAFFDAVMDANSHLRIHLARHPLRDSWHAVKHMMRLCLLGCGYMAPRAFRADWVAATIACACGLVMGKLIWDAVYSRPRYWLALDERVKISTGWAWLDRMLGFHW
mgnify:CR=1 FL=1